MSMLHLAGPSAPGHRLTERHLAGDLVVGGGGLAGTCCAITAALVEARCNAPDATEGSCA